MYGPLLSVEHFKSPTSQWALKRKRFREEFFSRVVLADALKEGRLPLAYKALAVLRLLLVFAPQTGYVHPDEFFQSLEPVAGRLFSVEWRRAWELNATNPLRSALAPAVVVGWPLSLLALLDSLLSHSLAYFGRPYDDFSLISPYSVLVAPRLAHCLLSFAQDYCLYEMCRVHGVANFGRKLLFLATSHVAFVYCARTLSNAVEAALAAALLLAVSGCMLETACVVRHEKALAQEYERAATIVDRVKLWKIRKLLPEHALSRCPTIATLCVVGFFNRPTFGAYALPAVFLWLVRGVAASPSKKTFARVVTLREFHARLFAFAACCVPAAALMILVDSAHYGYLTLSDVESWRLSAENFVVTPLNFIRYNALSENLAAHGLHPRWLHALVNLPLLFNVLAMLAFAAAAKLLYRLLRGRFSELPRIQSLNGLMGLSIMIPLGLLSVFPHQEPRFLLPLQLPMIFLFVRSDPAKKSNSKSVTFAIWCAFNLFLTLFYGFLHQGGIVPFVRHAHREMNARPKFSNTHVVTNHMYDIPHSLLLSEDPSLVRINPKTKQKYRLSKHFFLYELGSKPLDGVIKYSKAVWDLHESKLETNKQPFQLYLIFPSTLKEEFVTKWSQSNMSLSLKEETLFYPHLSTEALPYFPTSYDAFCTSNYKYEPDVSTNVQLTTMERIVCFLRQFSLILYKVEKHSNFFLNY